MIRSEQQSALDSQPLGYTSYTLTLLQQPKRGRRICGNTAMVITKTLFHQISFIPFNNFKRYQ